MILRNIDPTVGSEDALVGLTSIGSRKRFPEENTTDYPLSPKKKKKKTDDPYVSLAEVSGYHFVAIAAGSAGVEGQTNPTYVAPQEVTTRRRKNRTLEERIHFFQNDPLVVDFGPY